VLDKMGASIGSVVVGKQPANLSRVVIEKNTRMAPKPVTRNQKISLPKTDNALERASGRNPTDCRKLGLAHTLTKDIGMSVGEKKGLQKNWDRAAK